MNLYNNIIYIVHIKFGIWKYFILQYECKEWHEALNILDMVENNNMRQLTQSFNESHYDLVMKEVSIVITVQIFFQMQNEIAFWFEKKRKRFGNLQ